MRKLIIFVPTLVTILGYSFNAEFLQTPQEGIKRHLLPPDPLCNEQCPLGSACTLECLCSEVTTEVHYNYFNHPTCGSGCVCGPCAPQFGNTGPGGFAYCGGGGTA
jgi:hypothetical protein